MADAKFIRQVLRYCQDHGTRLHRGPECDPWDRPKSLPHWRYRAGFGVMERQRTIPHKGFSLGQCTSPGCSQSCTTQTRSV